MIRNHEELLFISLQVQIMSLITRLVLWYFVFYLFCFFFISRSDKKTRIHAVIPMKWEVIHELSWIM